MVVYLLAVFVLGLSSIVGQIIILRELSQVFYGNELSFAIILTAWLFWGAVGSGIFSRISYRLKSKVKIYFSLIFAGALVLTAILIVTKLLRIILGMIPGEIITLPTMFLASFAIVAPFCVLQGFLFTLAPHFGPDEEVSRRVNLVYLFEALGAFVGGASYYFLGIHRLDPFQGIFLLNAVVLALLLPYLIKNKISHILTVIIIAFSILFCASSFTHKFQFYFTELAYNPFSLVATSDSKYGNITVTSREKEINFYENGVNLFSTSDELSREEIVHFAMLYHPDPKQILLIGGGVSSTVGEILKHKPDNVTYVELDPLLIQMGKEYLPEQNASTLNDRRVNIINTDGRYYVKEKEAFFDVIILGLPEPYNLQLNRFYTEEFFGEITKVLKPKGIFSFLAKSSESYMNDEQIRLIKSFKETLQKVFSDALILPGDTNVYLATNTEGLLSEDYKILLDRAKDRGLTLKFVNEYYLPTRLNRFKFDFLDNAIASPLASHVNLDFKPMSYYYDIMLWGRTASVALSYFMKHMLAIEIRYIYGFIFIIFLVLYFTAKRNGLKKRSLLASVSFLGLTEISLEVIIILAFQILYGFIYSKISIIIAAYMLGLYLGTHAGRKINKSFGKEKTFNALIILELAMCIYVISIWAILNLLHTKSEPVGIRNWIIAFFPVLTAVAGLIGGCQFPVANRLYLEEVKMKEARVGSVYSCDLFGSSLGALFMSTIIIPLFGISQTLYLLFALNLFCFGFLLLAKTQTAAD